MLGSTVRQYGWFWYCCISPVISATLRRLLKLTRPSWFRFKKSGFPSSVFKMFVRYMPAIGGRMGGYCPADKVTEWLFLSQATSSYRLQPCYCPADKSVYRGRVEGAYDLENAIKVVELVEDNHDLYAPAHHGNTLLQVLCLYYTLLQPVPTYPSVDDLEDGVGHLLHGLALHCVEETLQFLKQAHIAFKVIEMVVHPVTQHIHHSGNIPQT
ncbi:hypothetical protein MAR_001858 [Mya arenaria]|uniref:Uncharacterized protein n=1 Tax=Mya arenaria TaxID=6604 RepID=A0ABY7FCZ2_MYAAR|nr:hypothetical protein MAR_001858 [Mya arenaria]